MLHKSVHSDRPLSSRPHRLHVCEAASHAAAAASLFVATTPEYLIMLYLFVCCMAERLYRSQRSVFGKTKIYRFCCEACPPCQLPPTRTHQPNLYRRQPATCPRPVPAITSLHLWLHRCYNDLFIRNVIYACGRGAFTFVKLPLTSQWPLPPL